MKAVLLIDFGSTYTKVTAVSITENRLLGSAASYTTVETDIGDGLENALKLLERQTGKLDFTEQYACSSAAGGLRMLASGMVPGLTAKAAHLACLGAGAKLVKVFSYKMTDEDLSEIEASKPDIFLLAGGTDGGNTECILHNAAVLANSKAEFPIIIAGNREAAAQCEKILAVREVMRIDNVMPTLTKLNIEPTQQLIREIFLRRIVQAKGMSKASELLNCIMMPTPTAMFKAMELLSNGPNGKGGLGDLVAIDLGGATTDVYSIASGLPQREDIILKGLPEPRSKRTVEGDIGMRYGASGILDVVGAEHLSDLSGLPTETVTTLIKQLQEHPDTMPDTPEQAALDYALACGAIETAMTRHAGTMEAVYTPMGQVYAQAGKDLREVSKLILTGGAIVHNADAGKIASYALYSTKRPNILCPKSAKVYVDRKYILSAMGLLGDKYPDVANNIMTKELDYNGTDEQAAD